MWNCASVFEAGGTGQLVEAGLEKVRDGAFSATDRGFGGGRRVETIEDEEIALGVVHGGESGDALELIERGEGVHFVVVDLVPGEWTPVKITVQGDKAKLFVHGSEQPTLVVNDLKNGTTKGAVALWIGPGTVAHFANLKIAK